MRDWKKHVRERLGDLGLGPEREAGVVEEIAQGLEARFADLVAQGLSERQALGEIDRTEADWSPLTTSIRETKGESLGQRFDRADPPRMSGSRLASLTEGLWQDMQSARRHLAARPWTNVLAVLLLAVGAGAAAVAFVAVRAVLFPPLLFDDADRVVVLHHRGVASGREMNFPGVFGPVDFYRLRELPQVFERVEGWTRLTAILSGPVGGIYGSVAFEVSRRTSEIGLRMALGATRSRVVRSFASGALALGLAGTALGLVLAIAGSRAAASQLYGFRAVDPATYAAAAAALLAMIAVAALVAAAKATAIDPMVTLRRE